MKARRHSISYPIYFGVLAFIGFLIISAVPSSAQLRGCSKGQFQCSPQLGGSYGTTCISQQWRCDGEPDCPNGDDEVGCRNSNEVITNPPTAAKTDNNQSCTGNNCSYQSNNSNNSMFDGPMDDQININGICRLNEFQCTSGDPPKCFPSEYRCDHDQDCPDGSDEADCFHDETEEVLSNQTICQPGDDMSVANSTSCVPSIRCHNLPEFFPTESSAKNNNNSLTNSTLISEVGNGTCSCDLGFQIAAINAESGAVVNASSASTSQQVCIDEDECSLLGPDLCSQDCINTFGSYKCKCADGFHLTPDGHTCKAYGQSMVLVFSNGTDIFISNGQVHSAIVTKLSNANDLAMEHSRNLIYWSDSSTRKIQRSAVFRPASPTAAPKDDVVSGDIVAPNGLTVDWLRRLLFWVDGGRQLIEVVDMNAPNTLRRAIVWEDIVRPRDIVCHPFLGLLFWAEWGNNDHRPRIERIYMDGSEAHMVAHKQVYRPCGLVIDFSTDRLFWVDAEKLTLESSDLHGRHRTFVIPEQTRGGLANQPAMRLLQPIACAVFEDFAYVSDQAERAVYRVRRHPLPRDSSDVVLNAFTPHAYGKLGSLLVFHNATQPNFQITPCSATGLNCSHLCLPRGAQHYSCACATGYTLQSDNRTCLPPEPKIGYVYLRFEKRLSRISLEGPDFVDRTFFSLTGEDDSHITAFDVDLSTSTFFFAKRYSSDQMLSLYAANLPNPVNNSASTLPPRHVLTLGTDHSATGHFEVSVDWITGNIYLLLASIGRIEVVSPLVSDKKSHRAVVAWNFISKEAHSLSLHPREGLMFWVDVAQSSTSTPTGESFYIIRSGLDGSRLARFLEIGPASNVISHRPSLVAAGNRLFWTSDNNHAIMSIKLDGTDKQVHVQSANRQPTLLAAVTAATLPDNNKFYFYDAAEMALFSTSLARNFSTLRIRPTLDGLLAMKIPTPVVSTPPVNNPCRQAACSHLCLLSPELIGYRCACAIGYTLRQDGTTCSRNFESLLLVAHGQGDLLQVDLSTPYSASLPLPLNPTPQNVVAVAADPTQNTVCWADNGRKMVACSGPGLDTSVTGSEVIATELDSVESIAYDYMNKNLYMADTVKPQIAVVHVPSRQLRLLLMRFTINQPRSLALSLYTGHVFWSEWNAAGTTVGGARIGRVDMDGSNAITIIDGGLGWPQGITVDNIRQRVYWGDAHLGRIESCNFEGDDRSVFLTSVNPYGLVVVGSSLYWTDPESRTIRASKLFHSNHSQSQSTTPIVDVTPKGNSHNNNGETAMKTIISDTKNLFGLSLLSKVASDQQLTACDISCAGLCLRRPHGHRCLCPTGFQPTPTATSCQPVANQIVLIVGESAVSLVFLGDLTSSDNTQSKQIAAKFPAVVLRHPTEQQKIVGADLHWDSVNNPLYYAVTTPNSSIIFRTQLSAGFRQERLFSIANATVLSLTVDPVSSNVYWFETRWSTTLTYLRVASITKLMVKTLLTNGFEQPKDLTVHPTRGRLFWINLAGPAAIESSLGDGTDRRVLVSRDTGSPASLTLDVANNLLYWTDTLTSSLHVCDLAGRTLQTISSGVARQAAVLAVSMTHIFWASGKGKAVFYATKTSIANNGQAPLRLTEMHQGIRGIGIYNQPTSTQIGTPEAVHMCSNSCEFICLRRGESQLVCTCPDKSDGTPSCSGDEVMNASTVDQPTLLEGQTTVTPTGQSATVSQSLLALIGVALIFVFVIIAVVVAVCRQRFVRNHHQHRHRSRSDSMMSILLCDPCWWSLPSRQERGRSTSPHATLTSMASGGFGGPEDDAGLALMAVTNEKAGSMPEKAGIGIDESGGGDSGNNGQRQRQQQGGTGRQCSTVVSLRFDATDGGDNITVKRVETVL